jgi:hypothetical protein
LKKKSQQQKQQSENPTAVADKRFRKIDAIKKQ